MWDYVQASCLFRRGVGFLPPFIRAHIINIILNTAQVGFADLRALNIPAHPMSVLVGFSHCVSYATPKPATPKSKAEQDQRQ